MTFVLLHAIFANGLILERSATTTWH